MNKGLQVFLLILLFAVSGFIGYVVEGIVIEPTAQHNTPQPVVDTIVVPEPEIVLSTIPVISENGITAAKRNEVGKYSFSVEATVESGDVLKYVLYRDETCLEEVVCGTDSGLFENVPGVANATYYLRVQNTATGEYSDVFSIKGFVQIKMYAKIQKAELERLINSGNFEACPRDYKERRTKNMTIVTKGIKPDEREVSSLADIFSKISMGQWASVTVDNIVYDDQGRMSKLFVSVNY